MHILIMIKKTYETKTAIMCQTVSVGKPGDLYNIVQFKYFPNVELTFRLPCQNINHISTQKIDYSNDWEHYTN